MLTILQENKFERFFYILDFDRNGVIEKDDFVAIAENLCILWGLKEGDEEYNKVQIRFSEGWDKFNHYVNNDTGKASWEDWKRFAETVMIDSDEKTFNTYVEELCGELFDNFDTDRDGYISLEEFIDLFVAHRIEVRFAAKSFRNLDKSKDGQISRGELLDAVKEFFRSDDPDAPGNWLFGGGFLVH
jgi:Ca2+-binding EF-hand superfamily protein